MSRTTLAIRLKPEADRAGEHVVRVRITRNRTSAFWALNLSIPSQHFNEAGNRQLRNWVRKSYREHKLYNERIAQGLLTAEEAVYFLDQRQPDYTARQVREYLEKGGYPDRLLPFFAAHIQKRQQQSGEDMGKRETASVYVSTLKVLRAYVRHHFNEPDSVPDEAIDERHFLLGKLTKSDISEFKAWLCQHYATNSVATYLGKLRHVLYQAAEEGLVSYERFPMRGITAPSARKKVNRLREAEVEHLATSDAPKQHPGGKRAITAIEHARPLALAMYLCHGARLGDAIMWRVENYLIEGDQHRLRYQTSKSKKNLSVLLDQQAIELFAPYLVDTSGAARKPKEWLLPYLPADYDQLPAEQRHIQLRRAKLRARQQIVNLGERVGLTKRLTPHVMRHSFADMMRRNGVPLETRQEVLGHSDIKSTRTYEEQFDQEAVDKVSGLYSRSKIPTTIVQQE